MNDIERRTLIGAAGIGAIAALSKAGPLNPPAGTVAPTGRTLDEIFNRIPAAFPPVGGYDGRTPIPGGAGSVTINTPGSYVLTGNLLTAGTAITVTVASVALDLNGFRVGSASTLVPVISASNAARLVIRNGMVAGGEVGVDISGSSHGLLIENLIISGARFGGIIIGGPSSPGSVIRLCSVIDTGANTVAADTANTFGISTTSNLGSRIQSCTVTRTSNNGSGLAHGIECTGTGAMVADCLVTNTVTAAGSIGLRMAAVTIYRDNTVTNFATEYNGGFNAGGNF